jgi:hypothetical protein
MQVEMLVSTGSLVAGQIVKIAGPVGVQSWPETKQDWVRTNRGQYIHRDWVRRISGSPV